MSPDFVDAVTRLEANLAAVIRGKSEAIRLLVTSVLAGGHTLLEDVPGTGKTTLAKALAHSLDGVFHRIQFTPDLMPADITGCTFYHPKDGTFAFREGPVFANVLLADEINRTSPRTQSALLEVMSELQVSVEGRRRDLPRPFFVVATQNPASFHGTYPLPEAQLDRFAVSFSLGYPDLASEVEVLYGQNDHHPIEDVRPVLTCAQALMLMGEVKSVHVDRGVAEYIVRILAGTRADARLRTGISPRGSLALYRTAQARARIAGRDHVLPEDVRAMALPVLAHRIVLDTKAKYAGVTGRSVVEEILGKVPVPR